MPREFPTPAVATAALVWPAFYHRAQSGAMKVLETLALLRLTGGPVRV
jgi:hypothetical protein